MLREVTSWNRIIIHWIRKKCNAMNRSWSFLCLLVGDFGGLLPALPRGAQRQAGISPLLGRAVSKHRHVLMRGKLLSHKSETRSGQRQSSHRPQELQELSPFCLQHWKRDLTSMQCYKGIAQQWHYPTQKYWSTDCTHLEMFCTL